MAKKERLATQPLVPPLLTNIISAETLSYTQYHTAIVEAVHTPEALEATLHPRFTHVLEEGHGGHGIVYSAYDQTLGRYVGLKVVNQPRLIDGYNDPKDILEEAYGNLKIESAQLSRFFHPHLVQVYEHISWGTELGRLEVIVMEYLNCGRYKKLSDFLVKNLPTDTKLEIVAQTANLLGFLYENTKTEEIPILQRDISDNNILWDTLTQTIKLLDFSNVSQIEQNLGKPNYLAPEYPKRNSHKDVRAEIWSLTCLAFYMFTGERYLSDSGEDVKDYLDLIPTRNFHGLRTQELELIHKTIDANPDLHHKRDEIEGFFVKGLFIDPDFRHQTFEQFGDELQTAFAI